MARYARTLAALLLSLPLLTPIAQAQNLPPVQVVPQITRAGLQPGDRLTLTLFNQQGEKLVDIGGERVVNAQGMVFLPFLNATDVRGMTQAEVRAMLDRRYEEFYAGSVVEVTMEYRVSVTGAVRNAGSYFLPPTATLVDALAEAGGAGAEIDIGAIGGAADPSQARLTRVGYDSPITINFRPLEATQEILQAPIQSGDWIYVPPARRSRLRDDILFVGNILAVVVALVSVIILIDDNTGGSSTGGSP